MTEEAIGVRRTRLVVEVVVPVVAVVLLVAAATAAVVPVRPEAANVVAGRVVNGAHPDSFRAIRVAFLAILHTNRAGCRRWCHHLQGDNVG